MDRAARLLLVTPLIAVACGVLTVDVDIYKGPLANHEEVQMEQLAVMAVGARPLLIQLRNTLETDQRKKDDGKSCACERPGRTCYADEAYVKDPRCLTSPDARLVNAILGLYLDQEVTGVGPLIAEGRRIFEECTRLRAEMDDFEADRRLWRRAERIVRGADPLTEAIEALLVKEESRVYRDPFPLAKLVDLEHPPGSTTGAFERLTRRDRVEALLAKPFSEVGDEEDLREDLVRRIVQLGEDYLRGRELLERAFQIGLDLISELSSRPSLDHDTREALYAAIEATYRLIQPCAFAQAIANPAVAGMWPDRSSSSGSLREFQRLLLRAGRGLNGGIEDGRSTAAVREWFDRDPLWAVLALKAVHGALKRSFTGKAYEDSPCEREAKALQDPVRRQFGIVRALTLDAEDGAAIVRAFERFQALVHLLSDLGLERGRLPDGLQTLIEKYLQARDHLEPDGDVDGDVRLARRRLVDALVHFAEKVLFIVDHDAVVRACETSGDDCRESYVMLLESIGNSILTLNDNLRHRWDFDDEEEQRRAGLRELRAARQAWSSDAGSLFDQLVRAVRDKPVVPPSLDKELHEGLSSEDKEHQRAAEAAASRAKALMEIQEAWKRPTGVLAEARRAWAEAATAEAPIPSLLEALADRIDKWVQDEIDRRGAPPPESELLASVAGDLRARAAELTKQEPAPRNASAVQAFASLALMLDNEIGKKRQEQEKEQASYDAALEKALTGLRSAATSALQGVRPAVLAKAAGRSGELTRQDLLGITEAELKGLMPPPPLLDQVLSLLEAQPIAPGIGPVLSDDARSPREVLDQVAAALRAQRVVAVANAGEASALVRRLDDALRTVEAFRSPTVYIRPPADFLRNSSAVTSLQESHAGWSNELQDHALRSFFGTNPSGAAARRLQTRRTIDRQFWQNINRVRVAGAGATDYVLVKDDIGNWYVHSYSSDPRSIIQGVKSIALSAAGGGALGAALGKEKEAGESAPASSPSTVLESQVDYYEDRYGKATREDSKALREALAGLRDRVLEDWSKAPGWDQDLLTHDRDSLEKDYLDAAATKLELEPPPADDAQAAAFARDCTLALGKALDFEAELLRRVTEGELVAAGEEEAAEPTQEDRRRLVRSLREAVVLRTGGIVDDLLEQRRDAVEELDTALMVLGRRVEH